MASFSCHGFGVTKQVRLERLLGAHSAAINDLADLPTFERKL
jgi:hypothetical protein